MQSHILFRFLIEIFTRRGFKTNNGKHSTEFLRKDEQWLKRKSKMRFSILFRTRQ